MSEKEVDNIINNAIKAFNLTKDTTHFSYNRVFDYAGAMGTVTPKAIAETERRLLAFPDVCLRLKNADGIQALLLTQEIRIIKSALFLISDDPYYKIISNYYFYGNTMRNSAFNVSCDISSIIRNKKRLLKIMAFRLYGVDAWTMM